MKICTTCKTEKPLSEFPKLCKKRAHIGDGYQPQCRECRNAHNRTPAGRKAERLRKARYFSNPEKLAHKKERERKYFQTKQGKESRANAQKKYSKTQKGKVAATKGRKKYEQTQKYKDSVNKSRLKFPEKRKAGIIVMNALRTGKIVRPLRCSSCNKPCTPEGHHPDYSRPLDVVWVCKACHTAIHWLS